ncbi:MAG: hypothetical protein HY735_03965 [Verrucomicrobia bacterium]|nr:hypothetical protein [Verrucomicrobiota bacterium]
MDCTRKVYSPAFRRPEPAKAGTTNADLSFIQRSHQYAEISMETKDLLGLILIPSAIVAATALACFSQRARDAMFFFLLAGGVMAERLNINFVSQYWYRGTSRGFEVSFVDILAVSLLASACLFPRYKHLRRYWPLSLGPMILYFIYACFSVAISEPKLYGVFELAKIVRAMVFFLAAAWFVQTERELKLLILGLGCAVLLEGAYVFKQRFVSGIYRAVGTLDHANSLSMYLCMTAPVLAAAATAGFPRWIRWLAFGTLGVAVVSIVLTVSRAGIPIFCLLLLGTAVFTMSFRLSLKKIAAAAAIAACFAGFLVSQWENLKIRYQIERSLEEEYFDERSEGRGHYFLLAKAIVDDQFWGVGLNNWSYWVCKKYGAERGWFYEDYDDLDYVPPKEALSDILYAPPAHNLGALTVGELGWPGLAIFGILWFHWFRAASRFLWRRSPAMGRCLGAALFFSIFGVFLQSFTEWVFRQPSILFTFHVLLGVLASLCYQKRVSQPACVETVQSDSEELCEPKPAYPAFC